MVAWKGRAAGVVMPVFYTLLLPVLFCLMTQCDSFRHSIALAQRSKTADRNTRLSLFASPSFRNQQQQQLNNDDEDAGGSGTLTRKQQQQQQQQRLEQSGRLLVAALSPKAAMVPLSVQGMSYIPRLGSTRNGTIACAVLARRTTTAVSETSSSSSSYSSTTGRKNTRQLEQASLLPVPGCDTLDRLYQYSRTTTTPPVSRLQLLLWNGEIINRDNGLFDNLPYTAWTAHGPRDAAGQPVASTYHLGKRQFYNRLMGQDWYKYARTRTTRSSGNGKAEASSGNVNSQKKKKNQNSDEDDARSSRSSSDFGDRDSETTSRDDADNDSYYYSVLQYRISQLQLREVQMQIAQCDYEIAILKKQQRLDDTDEELNSRTLRDHDVDAAITIRQAKLDQWQTQRTAALQEQERIGAKLEGLKSSMDGKETESSRRRWDGVIDGDNDGKAKDDEIMSFDNPFKMFQSLVREMLKAEIVAVFLEDVGWTSQEENQSSSSSSSRPSSIVLGGGIVLQRETVKETVSLWGGEKVQITNETETFGSDVVKPGELYVVDCFADEAVKLSIACDDLPLWCEASLLMAGSLPFASSTQDQSPTRPTGLAEWQPVDGSTVLSVQGRPVDTSASDDGRTVAKVQLNFDLLSRWEQAMGGGDGSNSSSSKSPRQQQQQVFPTNSPVQSLAQYDALSSNEKIRLLLSLGDAAIKIPRPRAIRTQPRILDDLLLPRVDEVVRTQWRLREAGTTGDEEEAANIPMSKRFVAKAKAEAARGAGADDVADWWDNEATLLGALRADITQDEGSYNRYLDKDDWYERDRRAAAERARQQFGDLSQSNE